VKRVILNNPPYKLTPLDKGVKNKLLYDKKVDETKAVITTLENSIDFSRINVTAFETKRFINNDVSTFCVSFLLFLIKG
jgi:hypothetical protein